MDDPIESIKTGAAPAWDEWVARKRSFDENRRRFPVQQFISYVGQVVAWQPDGSAIREAGSDFTAVRDKIQARGEDPSLYVYESIPSFCATPGAGSRKEERLVADPPITLEQILAGFTPPPGPEAGEEETRRYWEDYYEKRRMNLWNRPPFTEEQLVQYAGKTLVLSTDGTSVLAVGPDLRTVVEQIRALGLDSGLLVIESIPNDPFEMYA